MIEQALFGYREGHRCLASSPGVAEAQHYVLDRCSDLTGHLPMGFTFEAYYQGFPCGDAYAFTCTWYDHGAPRSGAVLTHALLVPKSLISEVKSPGSLRCHFRRPAGAADTAPFKAPIAGPLPDEAPDPAAPELLALWAHRPILRVTPATGIELVAGLWASLEPLERVDFRFCTMALGMITLGKRAFDYYQCPPQAVSGFWNMARGLGWWEDGRRNPVLAALLGKLPPPRQLLTGAAAGGRTPWAAFDSW